MVLALGLAHSRQAIDAQRAVSDMTNELDVYKRQMSYPAFLSFRKFSAPWNGAGTQFRWVARYCSHTSAGTRRPPVAQAICTLFASTSSVRPCSAQ